jgi:2',3'-cyclic-nucleotide 2'-phosphodiesterase (5'-nucleotidase family)
MIRWGQYLGRLDVAFAPDSGKIMATTGAPIVISENVTQDADLQAQVEEWRVPFDEFGKQVIGSTNTVLDQDTCYQGECMLSIRFTSPDTLSSCS